MNINIKGEGDAELPQALRSSTEMQYAEIEDEERVVPKDKQGKENEELEVIAAITERGVTEAVVGSLIPGAIFMVLLALFLTVRP